MQIKRIVSGGQTGADRAALDVAIELGIHHGGWVPRGRTAEDGVLNKQYKVNETPSEDVAQRTEWNVRDSDATLLISQGPLAGGSELTWRKACEYIKPVIHVDLALLSIPNAAELIRDWLSSIQCLTLNIAGQRQSEAKEIYDLAKTLLKAVFRSDCNKENSKENIDVALKIYEQAYCNFRHWDQIRWLVPYWFATLATAGGGIIALIDKNGYQLIQRGLFFFGFFSLLCFYLLCRLIVYHNKQFRDLSEDLKSLLPDGAVRRTLSRSLPFSFKIKDLPKTSTFWFMIIILIIGIMSIKYAIFDITSQCL